jgi:hypothetical protein
LLDFPPAYDGSWVRHLRLDHTVTIKCQGKESTGIIMYREDLINRTCTYED